MSRNTLSSIGEGQSSQLDAASDLTSCYTSPESPTPLANEWVPNCDEELKPKVGQLFDSLERCSEQEDVGKLISDIWDLFFSCMEKAGTCKEKLLIVKNGLANIEKELAEFDSKQTNADDLQTFIGSKIPKEEEVFPPQISKTKGSGKRIKCGKQKAVDPRQKRTRLCRACSQYAHHDSRNCPQKLSP